MRGSKAGKMGSARFPCLILRPYSEDSRGRAAEKSGGDPMVDARSICKGASGKTSGRSCFPNAPLRATSSALTGSMSHAIANTLPICRNRILRRVGFALARKLLRKVYKLEMESFGRFPELARLLARTQVITRSDSNSLFTLPQ